MKLLKLGRTLLLLAMLACGLYAPAQTPADLRMGELLNGGDPFRLREEYPQLKDSLSIEILDLLARSQLGIAFNRPEEAAPALDSLLLLHQDALGAESTLSMAALRAMNLLNLGMYAQAGAAGGDLVRALEGSLPFESYFGLVYIERIGKALSDVPAPHLERPERTVTVSMKYEAVGRGHHFYIPVEVNGRTHDFIFDTGCSSGCFVSEHYAAEVDAAFPFDGIIGYDLLRAVGEIVVDNEAGVFRFPVKPSDGEPDMYLSGNIPRVRIEYGGSPLRWSLIRAT